MLIRILYICEEIIEFISYTDELLAAVESFKMGF